MIYRASLSVALTLIIILVLCLSHPVTAATKDQPQLGSSATSACSTSESWHFSAQIRSHWQEEMRLALSGMISPAHSLSDAFALRQTARLDESRILGEYWISRSLFQAGLIHSAHKGFNTIVAYKITPQIIGIQIAAIECLTTIHKNFSTLGFTNEAMGRLTEFFRNGDWLTGHSEQPLMAATTQVFLWQLAEERSDRILIATSTPLKNSYQAFVRGLLASKQSEHSLTIFYLKQFLEASAIPDSLKRFQDQAHLLLSRAYFSRGEFDPAVLHLKQVRKSSNELIKTLSELAWSYLIDERYAESIGTALSLEAGALKHTFAPEAPMVMAMALNEICQFPESLRATQIFWKHYADSYKWLKEWQANTKPSQDGSKLLYSLTIRNLIKESDAPARISSEWIRSPVFISHQDELNLINTEKGLLPIISRAGHKELSNITNEIRSLATELKLKIRQARLKLKPDTPLPNNLRNELLSLKNLITHHGRFRNAATFWQAVSANHIDSTTIRTNQLLTSVAEDLSRRNLKMLSQLEEIIENNHLLEIEIYNGATEDIIWQNAHPDYKKIAKQLKDDPPTRQLAAKVWDWGQHGALDESGSEIWEDELGSFKARLFNNCSSKEKYMALKRKDVKTWKQ